MQVDAEWAIRVLGPIEVGLDLGPRRGGRSRGWSIWGIEGVADPGDVRYGASKGWQNRRGFVFDCKLQTAKA